MPSFYPSIHDYLPQPTPRVPIPNVSQPRYDIRGGRPRPLPLPPGIMDRMAEMLKLAPIHVKDPRFSKDRVFDLMIEDPDVFATLLMQDNLGDLDA